MKKFFFLLFTLGSLYAIHAQENMAIISGGYVFANIEDSDEDATGWRINASYEFNPYRGKFSHGIAIGYIETTASESYDGIGDFDDIDLTMTSIPVYYAPKYNFGSGALKGFLKGALGMHFSDYEVTGGVSDFSTSDSGFYGGLALGAMFNVSSTVFLNAEYEWAYLSNYYYKDGNINSIMGGIGMRF